MTAARTKAERPSTSSLTRREVLSWGVSSALLSVPWLSGCSGAAACPVPRPPGTWNNAVCSIEDVRPKEIRTPASAAELVAAVREAEVRSVRVRMAGSGHSFSDVAIGDDLLLLPERLRSALELDRSRLKPAFASDERLVRIQGGATIRSLNSVLDSRGLAFENLGGYDAQTLVGAAMTGTHGSGLAFGPIASQIVSLQLVASGGEMLQIEPSDGISDPGRFRHSLEEDASLPLRLVQDDRFFDTAVVSMGSCGIVYSAVVRAVGRYWLREERRLVTWRALTAPGGYLREFVRRPRDPGFPDHVEVTVVPYPNLRGEHLCMLTRRWRLAQEPPSTRESRSRGALGSSHLLADFRARKLTEEALTGLLDSADRALLAAVHGGLLLALVDKNYTSKSYEVYNIGDINQFRAYGVELSFDLRDTLGATEAMFRFAEAERREGRHHSVPVTLRFVKAAEAYLAMQYGRDTMMMEVGMLVNARGASELLRNYERHFLRSYAARPHWGLDLSILEGSGEVAALYPRWNDWLAVYRQLNRSGVFDGRWTDRLGISVLPQPGNGGVAHAPHSELGGKA